MLIAKKDLNEVFAQYHPELDECGNRVYWIQRMETETNAYPVTNVYADEIEVYGEYAICAYYKYTDFDDIHSSEYTSLYGYYWRLFDSIPTEEERNMPWDYIDEEEYCDPALYEAGALGYPCSFDE